MFKYFLFVLIIGLLSACKIIAYKSLDYRIQKRSYNYWDTVTQARKTIVYEYKHRHWLYIAKRLDKKQYFELKLTQLKEPYMSLIWAHGGNFELKLTQLEKLYTPLIWAHGRIINNKVFPIPYSQGFLSIAESDLSLLDTLPVTSPFDLPELYAHEEEVASVKYFEFGNANGREPHFFYITINPHRADSFIFCPQSFQKIGTTYEEFFGENAKIFKDSVASHLLPKNSEIRGIIHPTDTIEWFKVSVLKNYAPIFGIGNFGNQLEVGEYFYKPKKTTNSFFRGDLLANRHIFEAYQNVQLDTSISNIRIQKHLFGRLTLLYDKEQQTHKIRFKPIFIRLRHKKYYRDKMAYIEKNTELYETYQAQQLEYQQLMQTKKRP
jgi:hypothetical protein